ncbi:hypothetical protein SAMN04488498_13815 [Mesorhizobium albiziae]|uniref:Uncharacterized protein n=1 Tax=Neomesorhizobium albiziae TaxID=335020 RepID=A0A1I4FAR3_9HYPH|nr:hypothetical protein [Mesorhizobium albiziae]GLS29390.1 hypothetical protein GCM10007937_10980 [Mesorhizobium albiziae]SFL13481.1 hypothetical protein SAMN04488498_13815 [Mesorhizobium albiziae]
MAKRLRHSIDPSKPPLLRVLIFQRGGNGPYWVYCPPMRGELPWTQKVPSEEAAIRLASDLAATNQQAAVLITKDSAEWWMEGLLPEGGQADEYEAVTRPEDLNASNDD